MSIFSVFLLAVGLSMDAFAVSICKGLTSKQLTVSRPVIVGLWFGAFQALMPTLGYFLGRRFEGYIERIDHWIAFFLLLLIGINMIREAARGNGEETGDSLRPAEMLVLAIATSIDALAVGITLGFMSVRILPAVVLIGCTTFFLSAAGVVIGHIFGLKYQKSATLLGGGILILLGVKILLEHLGLLHLPF